MTISRPPSAISAGSHYDEDLDRQGFKLKDDYGIQTIHAPVDMDHDDPDNDIDSTDVNKWEMMGWYGYGFAAEAYGYVLDQNS